MVQSTKVEDHLNQKLLGLVLEKKCDFDGALQSFQRAFELYDEDDDDGDDEVSDEENETDRNSR